MGISLRPWSDSDLPLLVQLLGDPAMTEHLGGPETPEQIRKRHERYVWKSETVADPMFMIAIGPEKIPAGSIGYWAREWQGEQIWETGWSVLPEFQGQGIATKATLAVIEKARAEKKHRFMHAFPAVDNPPSNAICLKAGFTLQGAYEFEYPKGHFMQCNDWRFDLLA